MGKPQPKVLVDAKADVSVADNNGTAPVLLASQFGHSDFVVELLRVKAEVDAAMPNGCTALIAGARFGHLDVCRALLAAGADARAAVVRAHQTCDGAHHGTS